MSSSASNELECLEWARIGSSALEVGVKCKMCAQEVGKKCSGGVKKVSWAGRVCVGSLITSRDPQKGTST